VARWQPFGCITSDPLLDSLVRLMGRPSNRLSAAAKRFTLPKGEHDHARRVQPKRTCRKTASFASLFDHLAKAVLPFSVEKVSEGGVRCFSLVYPDTQFLLEHDVLADETEGDALALRFEMEGVCRHRPKRAAILPV